MRILISYRGIPHAPGFEIGAGVARGFRQLGHEVYPYGNVYQSKARIGDMPPGGVDLLVWVECNDQDPQYAELFKLTCPKVMWDFDTAMHVIKTTQLANALKPDILCLGNAEYLGSEWPGAKKTIHIPFGADPLLFRPGSGPRSGVGMIGTSFAARDAFCKRAGIELLQAYGQDYVSILQRLRLHLHHTTTAGDGLLVTRNFETLAAGCALITKDTPEVRRYFDNCDHLWLYKDDDHAIEIIRSLMRSEHDEEVARVAQAGRDLVMARHTYRHRVEAILEAL
tara:strand:- start:228 stop:1073 length:846 start_codon:yes stop_codon:yes gene_type:complete